MAEPMVGRLAKMISDELDDAQRGFFVKARKSSAGRP